MNQSATLVEAVARRAAIENGASGDTETAEELFNSSLTISESLRMLHELVQSLLGAAVAEKPVPARGARPLRRGPVARRVC
jgi:hypothetical protein